MAYRKTSFALIAWAAAIASPAFADVKSGVDAWSAGDFDTAVAEWRVPAQNGDADALFNMGQAYRLGRGVPANITRARELYSQAAEKGHVKAADNYGLLLFQQGEQKQAMPLIKAAAERGDPRAQYVLGLAHFNADYAERDWVRAYALLTLSQAAGLPQASGALKQMDEYVPLTQRQQAQTLARNIEAEAGKRRAAQLAAADLRQRQPVVPSANNTMPRPAPSPVPMRNVGPARASAPVSGVSTSVPASATPARSPVRVASATPAPAAPAAKTPAPTRAPAPAAKSGGWGVQLGAFGVAANAERLWTKLSSNPALSGTQKMLIPGGRVTRLRAIGFSSRAEASRACDQLSRLGQACIVSKPSRLI
ncbi:MAG: SPOR domain-containing protein [Pseudomonadota bacterium]